MEEYLAIIKIFAGSFAPRGTAFCAGQLLSINQNSAVFSLMGTTYGGNGQTTFALPDLRGRAPIGTGQGPGLSNYSLGQQGGTETVTLLSNNMPIHTHGLNPQGGTVDGDATSPQNNYLALSPKIGSGPNATTLKTYATAAAATGKTASLAGSTGTNQSGGSTPFGILSPYLSVNYIVILEGIYPSRN